LKDQENPKEKLLTEVAWIRIKICLNRDEIVNSFKSKISY